LLEEVIDEADFEWLMIDSAHIKVHRHGDAARGGNQDMGRTKRGSTVRYMGLWMRMVCRSDSLLHRAPQPIAQKLGIDGWNRGSRYSRQRG
jgi:hypothetical protein